MSSQLQQIQDRFLIEELVRRYGHYFDDGNLEGYFGLFAEDARVDIGAGETDKTGMMEQIRVNAEAVAGTHTRHFITNLVLDELTDEAASGAAYFLFTQTIEGVLQPGMTGTYQFNLRRTATGWRIANWQAKSDRS